MGVSGGVTGAVSLAAGVTVSVCVAVAVAVAVAVSVCVTVTGGEETADRVAEAVAVTRCRAGGRCSADALGSARRDAEGEADRDAETDAGRAVACTCEVTGRSEGGARCGALAIIAGTGSRSLPLIAIDATAEVSVIAHAARTASSTPRNHLEVSHMTGAHRQQPSDGDHGCVPRAA